MTFVWQNPNLTTHVWWLSWFTMWLSLIAGVVNLRAARDGFVEMRWPYLVTGILALFYFGWYFHLVHTLADPADLLLILRSAGVLTWIVVWIWPAVRARQIANITRKRTDSIFDKHEL